MVESQVLCPKRGKLHQHSKKRDYSRIHYSVFTLLQVASKASKGTGMSDHVRALVVLSLVD